MGREFIEYAGRKFWLQTSDRYFQSGVKTDPERLLHRRVWIDNFGPIPPGHDVHHKDDDWRNNDPLNLELLLETDHRRHHALERWKDPAMEALMRAGLENAREAAKAWHATPEGREWHRKNSLQAWKKRPWSLVRCTMCNDEFSTPFPSRAMLCSKACRNKESQAKYRALKNCPQCGVEFSFFKYVEPTCCSKTCAGARRRGVPPAAPAEEQLW